jgi:hypothetical protein
MKYVNMKYVPGFEVIYLSVPFQRGLPWLGLSLAASVEISLRG